MPRHYSPRWLTRKRGTSRQKGKRFPVKPRRHIKVASVLDSQQQMLAPRTPTKPKLPSDAQIIMEIEKLQKQRNFAFIPRSEIFKGFPDCDSLAVAERINALVKSGKLEETTKPYGKLGYVGLPTKPFPSSAHFPHGDVKEKDAKYGPPPEPPVDPNAPRKRISGKTMARIIAYENMKGKVVVSDRSLVKEGKPDFLPKKIKSVGIIEFDQQGRPIPQSHRYVSREQLAEYYLVP